MPPKIASSGKQPQGFPNLGKTGRHPFQWLENGLFPELLEWLLCRRIAQQKGRMNNLWYVDLDNEKQAELDEHNRGSSDNPTIR